MTEPAEMLAEALAGVISAAMDHAPHDTIATIARTALHRVGPPPGRIELPTPAPDSGERPGLRALVDEQAEDEGLWFIAQTAPEAYLQQELRRLHAAIETATPTRDAQPAEERLRAAYLRLLKARHESAHNGDVWTGGSMNPLYCAICGPEMTSFGMTTAEYRAALRRPMSPEASGHA
jgi:hypothetical protein